MFHILLSVVSYDIWFYISHVLLHSRRLYKFHSEHHEKLVPTALDTYHGHVLEGPFQGLGALLPLATYSFTVADILLVLSLLTVRGMMRHDGRFVWLIGNHRLLHHRHPQYNYGEYWLDRLCGTLYPNREEAIAGLLYM